MGAVKFSVANSGPALAAEEMERLFQPFWQAGQKTGAAPGSGLSICRSIVEAHGGSIWTEAAAGNAREGLLPAAVRQAGCGRRGLGSARETPGTGWRRIGVTRWQARSSSMVLQPAL